MTSNPNLKKLHNDLYVMLIRKGNPFNKKHGNWIIFWLNNSEFLETDTWNECIKLKNGTGKYNYWNGFEGKLIHYFGINFGGFSSNTTEEGYRYYISLVKHGRNKKYEN